MKLTNELKVGGLVVVTGIFALAFAWVIGFENPFKSTVSFYITYNFAGGIDIGSPVRVSGIKVGRVEKIEFFTANTNNVAIQDSASDKIDSHSAIVPLKIKVSVKKEAAKGIRTDSRFYINLAGIIGERYVEITPGHFDQPEIASGTVVAGIDPPRIDQLLSQSFDLAGKIEEIIRENKGDLAKSIEMLYKLSGNLNKTLQWVDKSAIFKSDLSKLANNLIEITASVRKITDKVQTPEGEKTLKLLHELLWRLEPLDSVTIRKFLQEEGMKVHFF
jgi:phospholipid/cholesterol/gamma-HCH transport system substrate-binding protein